jgi:hypothetical protein
MARAWQRPKSRMAPCPPPPGSLNPHPPRQPQATPHEARPPARRWYNSLANRPEWNTIMFDVRNILTDSTCPLVINLFDAPVDVSHGELTERLNGKFKFAWLPSPRTRIVADGKGISGMDALKQQTLGKESSLIFNGQMISRFLGANSRKMDGTVHLEANLNAPLDMGSVAEVAAIEFAVPNMHEFLDIESPPTNGRLLWNSSPWLMELQPAEDIKTRICAAETSGYAITHRGILRRDDGQLFHVNEAKNVFGKIYMLFWFIRGFATSPILPTGLSNDGQAVWSFLAPWDIDHWRGVYSWADEHYAGSFNDLFEGIMKCSDTNGRLSAISESIIWYVKSNANFGRLETSIILAQTALELLSWQHLVIEIKAVSMTKFKKLKAAGQIEELLAHLKIPTALLPHQKVLGGVGSTIGEALAGIRNDIVHPKKKYLKHNGNDKELLIETWRCGLWALELSILALLGYRGKYQDRRYDNRRVGQVDKVPWV